MLPLKRVTAPATRSSIVAVASSWPRRLPIMRMLRASTDAKPGGFGEGLVGPRPARRADVWVVPMFRTTGVRLFLGARSDVMARYASRRIDRLPVRVGDSGGQGGFHRLTRIARPAGGPDRSLGCVARHRPDDDAAVPVDLAEGAMRIRRDRV